MSGTARELPTWMAERELESRWRLGRRGPTF